MESALVFLLAMLAGGMADDNTCSTLMEEAGLDEYFGTAVSHRLHSLTLEDLRYYFKEDAPVENFIPTVNFNLTENAMRVLPHAMASGYDTTFKTIAMRHADEVLSNMDNKKWAIKNYNILEKVVHAIHMSELWEQARDFYKEFVTNPPSEELCGCVSDTEENGVLAELQLLALKIKFPGLTSGKKDLPYGKKGKKARALAKVSEDDKKEAAYEISYSLKMGKKKKSPVARANVREFETKLKGFDFDGEEDEVVDHAMEELTDEDQGLSEHLDGEKEWKAWKKGFKNMDSDDNFQFAMFIYCMLN